MQIKNTAGFNAAIRTLTNAAVGVIIVQTREPHRTQQVLREFTFSVRKAFRVWDCVYGWRRFPDSPAGKIEQDKTLDAYAALRKIADLDGDGQAQWNDCICVMHYPHWALPKNLAFMQLLKHYVRLFTESQQRLILLVPEGFEPPVEIANDVTLVDFPLPSPEELGESLGNVITSSLAEGSKGEVYGETERTILVGNASGMTQLEAENAFSQAIVANKKTWPQTPFQDFNDVLLECKTNVVKRSNVLEMMDPVNIDEVGGLDLFKSYIRVRHKAFTLEAKAFGVDIPNGVLLAGPPGCLSADTPMLYLRGIRNSGRHIRLDDLFEKFNGIASNNTWDRRIPTYLHSFDANTGKVFYNRVVSVINSGVKTVILLTTKDGRQLKLTNDHPVLTTDGFVAAEQLQPGTEIIVRGSMKASPSAMRYGRKPRVVIEGLKYYASGWKKIVEHNGIIYEYQRQNRARLVVEAHMNNLSYDDYIWRLKTDMEAICLKYLPSEMVVHHIDENPMNDELSNLQIMFKPDHDRLHMDEENFNIEYTTLDYVTNVISYGEVQTYDIQMESPGNNFATADGLIVHNTGKSLVAKAVAGVLRLPLIKLDIGKVFAGIVGESESRIRSALKQIEAMEPAVVLIDEIDKGLGGAHQNGGDSGVSKRVLGTILTHMQESTSRIYWIFTANRVEGLPPELVRKGRLDDVFCVSLPNIVERMEVLKIHLRKRKQDPAKIPDLNKAAVESKGYVSAEIESAVAQAVLAAFNDNIPVTGNLIVAQLKNMKPLSEAFKADFERMMEWAQDNARMTSTPQEEPAALRNAGIPLPGKPSRRGMNMDKSNNN